MWLRHKKARQPFEAICVIACSTIAEGSGRMVSSTPIRISPPAMPNRPDKNAVATISRPRAAIISAVMRISENISALLVLLSQTELSWPGISFPEAGGGMRRLLFLNGIKAFEAAARSGSFAGAGAELNVSAAAVSRMVHLLEQRLGVPLFERKANRLAMTAAGRAYQSGLTPISDALASLPAQVTAPSGVRAGVSILRPGAAGRGRRAGCGDGYSALYRRRPRCRTAGRAFCPDGAEGHALVSGLSQFSNRAARFRRIPALDHPRRGGTCRARQAHRQDSPCRLNKSRPSSSAAARPGWS